MRKILFYVALALLMLAIVLPVFWVISTSLKSPRDAFLSPPVWLFEPTWQNYAKVLQDKVFNRALVNSVLISLVSSTVAVLVGAMAAYGLVQQDEKTRRSQEKFILGLRIAPPIIFVIPVYYFAAQMRLLNNHALLIVVYVFMNIPFAISMLVTFFEEIPRELRDAAKVDGAPEFTIFRSVYLPAARGGLIATLIMCVLFTWNEFFVALVLSGRDTQTLPVSITSFLTFQGVQWGPLTAAATVVMLPMLVLGLLLQGRMVRGMSLGSVKG